MFLLKLQKLTISKSKIFTTNFLQKCGADRVRTCDPLRAREVLSQLSYSPKIILVVGLGRFELPTPALSERCSNQLSYKPRVKFIYCKNE